MVEKIFTSLKRIDYRLFLALLMMGFVPTIYKTVRIFFLGDLPADWGFNIASQLMWVNILYEVLQEALILPLFYLIGKSLTDKSELSNKIKTGLIVTFYIYGLMTVVIVIFAEPLTVFMSQKKELIAATVEYIRLEAIASIFLIIVQFLMLVIVAIKKDHYLYILLFFQMVLTILADTFLVSSLPFSFSLGVNGIAISNILVNIVLLFVVVVLLNHAGYRINLKEKSSYKWIREWIKVGGYSGLESLVRNVAFIFMVVKMVNVVGEQGTFWVANSFIWGWLLLPVLQLGQLVKRDCGESGDDAIKQKTLGYFAITGVIVIIWLITIPLLEGFIKNVMNVQNYLDVYQIVLISMFFYIIFAFNNVIDSIFYGIGKTNYMLFQSIIINSVFYGILFVLYLFGIYKPTLILISVMFASGIALDGVLTYLMFVWMLKKRKISIIN